jgi:hypothetical protein
MNGFIFPCCGCDGRPIRQIASQPQSGDLSLEPSCPEPPGPRSGHLDPAVPAGPPDNSPGPSVLGQQSLGEN